jgi:hypothetical protein
MRPPFQEDALRSSKALNRSALRASWTPPGNPQSLRQKNSEVSGGRPRRSKNDVRKAGSGRQRAQFQIRSAPVTTQKRPSVAPSAPPHAVVDDKTTTRCSLEPCSPPSKVTRPYLRIITAIRPALRARDFSRDACISLGSQELTTLTNRAFTFEKSVGRLRGGSCLLRALHG